VADLQKLKDCAPPRWEYWRDASRVATGKKVVDCPKACNTPDECMDSSDPECMPTCIALCEVDTNDTRRCESYCTSVSYGSALQQIALRDLEHRKQACVSQ